MSLKTLREDLCRHQAEDLPYDVQSIVAVLIRWIDHHRPLGPDGTHGDLHTPTCGCEDSL